ncbi:retrovirus-related pol polyprotein from transposon TNT 1-94 [Tanacetum coccineum]
MCAAQVAQPQVNPDSTIAQELYTVQRSVQSPRVGQALLQQLVRTQIQGPEGTTEGRKQNRNKSKSWKIGEIKDKEVNQAARDSDDALICCVKNTVEDRIMDSGASFHATYCKEELERFKLRSGKVRLADDKTLDIAGVGDVVLKTSFVRGNKRGSLYMVEVHPEGIGAIIDCSGSAALWFEEAEESFLHNVSKDKETGETAAGVAKGIVMLKMVPETPLQFGVAERLSQTFRVESTRLRVEVPKMLWADSVSTAYVIYHIPYIPIGLHIPEEEWRGKDTSLTHLKVFGCDLFIKVKYVCGEAMKCTFIGSGSDEVRYSFRYTKSHQFIRSRDITFVDSIYGARFVTNSSSLTKPIQKSQVVLVDILGNLAENDNIVWKKYIIEEMVSLEKNQTYSLVRISAGKKASQRLWMFKDKEEQNDRKSCEDDYNQRGFSASLAERKPKVQIEQNSIRTDSSTEATVDDMLFAGSDMEEFNKPKCEGSLSLLKILGTKSLAEMFTGLVMKEKLNFYAASTGLSSELITEDDVLPERGYSQFNDLSLGYLVLKVS